MNTRVTIGTVYGTLTKCKTGKSVVVTTPRDYIFQQTDALRPAIRDEQGPMCPLRHRGRAISTSYKVSRKDRC